MHPTARLRLRLPLRAVLAREAARVTSRAGLVRSVLRALAVTLVAALAAAPFAAAWGVGHAEVTDYLGPHRVQFATDYSGEVAIDLGPVGNAYLTSPYAPVGLAVRVGGVGTATQGPTGVGGLLSEQTLAGYTGLYADPRAALQGVVERLAVNAAGHALRAEAVLLLGFAAWRLRRQLLAPGVARHVTRRRTLAVYGTVVAVVVGSILVPRPPDGPRIPVRASLQPGSPSVRLSLGPDPASTVTVDSLLLADLLDRTVSGVRLLADRQEQAVAAFVGDATASLSDQLDRLPLAGGANGPRPGESVLLGFSDLHCNQAMTELLTRLAAVTRPRVVLSSGDDTVHGTAAERGCGRREAGIAAAAGAPLVVATGNHDSDVTEAQMRADGMTVLDGRVEQAGGLTLLGDDDPEHNVPFSVDRVRDREESQEQLATRLLGVAGTEPVDVLMVHQPAAATVLTGEPDPPARLVLWGHYHRQSGPTVLRHTDGTWTVAVQQGTAGGVKQPTLTSFSTPFSPPLLTADAYLYFRDDATGLVTGVQRIRVQPDARVRVDERVVTGNPRTLPPATRAALGAAPRPSPLR